MKRAFLILLLLAVLTIIGVGASAYFKRGTGDENQYRTATVDRGDLVITISATGTLEPEDVIDVGAQVAGQIELFGTDADGKTVDRRSAVKEGMVLAKIDDSLYQADSAQAAAQLAQANAGVQHAQADLGQMQATLDKAQRDWVRAQEAGAGNGVLSQEAFDQYKGAYEIAKANLEVGKAAITQAQGVVAQAAAGVKRADHNLDYCTIKSPVDGEIIDRRVNIGQTVVSSLNAPSLFLIAKDLKKMKVWASVNEADIGNVHPGQSATYTVDAFPNRVFKGKVAKVWLNASMTQNVVTYTVEISTDNSDSVLLPYMTANVKFEVNKRENVLLVPAAALHWRPVDQPESTKEQAKSATGEPTTRHHGASTRPSDGTPHEHGTVWVKDGTSAKAIPVRVGLNDGVNTEVQGDQSAEGTEVIVGQVEPEAAGATGAAKSPFMPQFGNRRRGTSSPH